MAQYLEKNLNQLKNTSSLSSPEIKEIIINYFFRYARFTDNKGRFLEIDSNLVQRIESETAANKKLIYDSYNQLTFQLKSFLIILRFKKFKNSNIESSRYHRSKIYLQKIHKIAPIFNYARAIHNLKILHVLFSRNCFWPTISTQLAIIIFVTDRNDPKPIYSEPIIQKNLRLLCACSAYAFHRSRNRLQIDKQGKITRPLL